MLSLIGTAKYRGEMGSSYDGQRFEVEGILSASRKLHQGKCHGR